MQGDLIDLTDDSLSPTTIMRGDLISLTDDNAVSDTTTGISGGKVTTNTRSRTAHRDSFSDLTGMMKAKRPYTPASPLTPRPLPPILATKGKCCSSYMLVSVR
jgi:hypothetical protein